MPEPEKGITKSQCGMRRMKTGVPGLNNLIEGGFPHPSTVMLTGNSGTGKTMFGFQFLYNGVQKYDEPGIYMRIQGYDTDVEWISQKCSLGIADLQEQEDLILTTYELGAFEKFQAKSVGRKIRRKLSKIIDSTGAKRVVIDSISPFGHLSSSIADYRSLIYSISRELKEQDCTSLFITEKSEEKNLTSFDIEPFVADGVIELKKERKRGKNRREISIHKMMATQTPLEEVSFNISDDGFKLLPSYYE